VGHVTSRHSNRICALRRTRLDWYWRSLGAPGSFAVRESIRMCQLPRASSPLLAASEVVARYAGNRSTESSSYACNMYHVQSGGLQ
jgi:hypothetical protein